MQLISEILTQGGGYLWIQSSGTATILGKQYKFLAMQPSETRPETSNLRPASPA